VTSLGFRTDGSLYRVSPVNKDYLPGSLGFDPLLEPPGPELASRILWFDALLTNVDRTPRNPNLLTWHGRLWLIDHGDSLYFHHASRSSGMSPKAPRLEIAVSSAVLET
jgi:hypothetical protein